MKYWREQIDIKLEELKKAVYVRHTEYAMNSSKKEIVKIVEDLLSEQKRDIIEELNNLDLFKGVDCWYDSLLEQYKDSDCIMCGTNPTRVKQATRDIINIIEKL